MKHVGTIAVIVLLSLLVGANRDAVRAQDVFSGGDQGGSESFNGGDSGPESGGGPAGCTGIDRFWSNGRCNYRPLPGYTGCGPYYNSYDIYVQATLKHLGGACIIRNGNQLWCHERQPGLCNPGAGGRPDSPLLDSGTRLTRDCSSICDLTVARAQPSGGPPPPVMTNPVTEQPCTPVASPADQQLGRQAAAAAHQLAVQTVMGTGSFLQGSAQVIDEYAQFMSQPPGVPAAQMANGIMKAGAAVADYWNNKNPKKNDALWDAAQKAVNEIRKDPMRNAGYLAGNALLMAGGSGACKIGSKLANTLGQRIRQAGTAAQQMQQVEKAAEDAAGAVAENGEGAGQAAAGQPGNGGPTGSFGGNGDQLPTAGGGPTVTGADGLPVVNDTGQSTNCVLCTIAGLLREMKKGVPTASQIYNLPPGQLVDPPTAYKLLAQNFGKSPPKYIQGIEDLEKLHAQGVPVEFAGIDELEKYLGQVLKSGAAGKGVQPKVAIFVSPEPYMSAKLPMKPVGSTSMLPGIKQKPYLPDGHAFAGVQTATGLILKDFQSQLFDANLIKQMFAAPWHPTAKDPKIFAYFVE